MVHVVWCRYCVSRSSTGTLSFMEWESVLRLVGINLGDHFSAHMTHRVRGALAIWCTGYVVQ